MADGDQVTTVPLNTNNDQPPGDKGADGFAIPDTYKDKPYLQNVKSNDDLYKLLDGSQQAIGKKVNFPSDQSTDEERLNFNRSAGMPEKAEEYVFEKTGEKEREVDVDNKFKEIFHKWGISGRSATGIQKDVEALVAETMKLKGEADDTAFNELSSKILGDKADEILASSKKIIEANIPQELIEPFKNLSNSALVITSTVIENIRKKYINEDTITEGDTHVAGQGKEELQKQSDNLMNHPSYKDAMHVDHKKTNDQIKDISQQLAKLK